MTSFLAIYRGKSIGEAALIAVSADPALVAEVSSKLLQNKNNHEDKVISEIENGKRSALSLIAQEGRDAES
jgi:hypothetical protein